MNAAATGGPSGDRDLHIGSKWRSETISIAKLHLRRGEMATSVFLAAGLYKIVLNGPSPNSHYVPSKLTRKRNNNLFFRGSCVSLVLTLRPAGGLPIGAPKFEFKSVGGFRQGPGPGTGAVSTPLA